MLITKNISNSKTYINITIHSSFLKECKNVDYKRISLASDFNIGLGNNTELKLSDIINVEKLVESKPKK